MSKFSEIQRLVFNNRCIQSGCHSGSNPAANLDLTSGKSYINLVGVSSSDIPTLLRVEPNDPDSSYLVQKIEGAQGIVGSRMPLGKSPLSSVDSLKIRQWISEGALITNIEKIAENIISEFNLHQNYPNPFNPETHVIFDVPSASHVKIEIFNTLGQRLLVLVDQDFSPGSYEVIWDGKNEFGQSLSSGVYFYRMTADKFQQLKRMLLLK